MYKLFGMKYRTVKFLYLKKKRRICISARESNVRRDERNDCAEKQAQTNAAKRYASQRWNRPV